MDSNHIYYKQVRLLISLLSFINKEKCFALKGGTAINLFVREFPRLSVDIDLVYLPVNSRDEAIQECQEALSRIVSTAQNNISKLGAVKTYQDKKDALRVVIQQNNTQVKIELSPVLRGVVYPTKIRSIHPKVEDEFGFAEMNMVSFEDLYAGKICAALDRQHPRDLYDLKLLLENEGITENLRKALIVYLISHPRPIHELLNPGLKPLTELFANEFEGLVFKKVSIEDLEAAREELIRVLPDKFNEEEKYFLSTFYQSKPQWKLLGLDNIEKLPAVKWKLINLEKLSLQKKEKEIKELHKILKLI